MASNILSRATDGFLGKLKDPETQSDVTANLMSQLYVLPNYQMPEQSIVTSKDPTGKIIADSCELRLYYYSHYGDSLAPIKITTTNLTNQQKRDDRTILTSIHRQKDISELPLTTD